jgi:hypothetical protein
MGNAMPTLSANGLACAVLALGPMGRAFWHSLALREII